MLVDKEEIIHHIVQMDGGKLQAIAEGNKLGKRVFVGRNIVDSESNGSRAVLLGGRIGGNTVRGTGSCCSQRIGFLV